MDGVIPYSLVRRCLKNGNVPSGEEFFPPGKAIWRRNTLCISSQINAVWRGKNRRLGMLTIFKQALGQSMLERCTGRVDKACV